MSYSASGDTTLNLVVAQTSTGACSTSSRSDRSADLWLNARGLGRETTTGRCSAWLRALSPDDLVRSHDGNLSVVGVFMVFGTLRLTDMAARAGQERSSRGLRFMEHRSAGRARNPLVGLDLSSRSRTGACCSSRLRFLMFLTCGHGREQTTAVRLPEARSESSQGYFTSSTPGCASACSIDGGVHRSRCDCGPDDCDVVPRRVGRSVCFPPI